MGPIHGFKLAELGGFNRYSGDVVVVEGGNCSGRKQILVGAVQFPRMLEIHNYSSSPRKFGLILGEWSGRAKLSNIKFSELLDI